MVGRCTICQERFDPSDISSLKCGHTFHLHCISNWLGTSNSSCPVCRRVVRSAGDVIQQLFFDDGEDSILSTPSPAMSSQMRKLIEEKKSLEEDLVKAIGFNKERELAYRALQTEKIRYDVRVRELTEAVTALRDQVTDFDSTKEKNAKLAKKNLQMTEQLKKLEGIERLMNTIEAGGTVENVDAYTAPVMQLSLKVMQKKYNALVSEQKEALKKIKALERVNEAHKAEKQNWEAKLKVMEDENRRFKHGAEEAKLVEKTGERSNLMAPLPGRRLRRFRPISPDHLPAKTRACKMVPFLQSDDSDDDYCVPIRFPTSRGKRALASTSNRDDGFGGKAQFAAKTPANAKKPKKVAAAPAKRRTMPKSKNVTREEDDDDDIIILSD